MCACTGGVGYFDERFIEYDLDVEDVKWLEAFNRGQQRLPQRRFELLLWRLEVANAEATDAALAAAGNPSPQFCTIVQLLLALPLKRAFDSRCLSMRMRV